MCDEVCIPEPHSLQFEAAWHGVAQLWSRVAGLGYYFSCTMLEGAGGDDENVNLSLCNNMLPVNM